MYSKIKLFIGVIILFFSVIVSEPINAQSFKDILNGLSSGSNSNGESNSGSKSKVSDILSAVGKTVSADVKYSTLVGTWDYTGAAVGFQSDNLLKKAGGAAAATTLEKKITPYYNKAGLNSVRIIFNEDSTFTMALKKIKLNGTIQKGSDKNCYAFKFKALGKANLGSANGYIVSEGSKKISLTFDASKLIALVEKVAKVSGSSSIKTLSSLLSSYDGCTIGFKMKQTSTATDSSSEGK